MITSLYPFGWNAKLNQLLPNYPEEMIPGRIMTVHKTNYIVQTASGEYTCELAGQLQFNKLPEDLPHTGDWVLLLPYDPMGIITEVLPRHTVLARKYPGKTTGKQVLVTNVDMAILVQGLDRDFNPARLERMLVGLKDAGIKPIIALNKMDLSEESAQQIHLIQELLPDVAVYGISAITGEGLQELEGTMEQGLTYVLLGTSGAGKSTLLNALSHQMIQKTNAMSDTVGKGKHTTTNRELFLLPNGCLMIDTPGVREFALALDDTDAVASTFSEIERLAHQCRYHDCSHTSEAGCAVIEAVENHELDESVYNSYLKLKREADHYAASTLDKKRKSKDLSRLIKNMKKGKHGKL
ncbi:MAG: ribosome small subunit-dependent GTPase A [Marinilabiliaceae bacterium]|nr:ribosome small subunit-dependent GTPase A [Marinilabiliaceae bacterium]